jgi:hypothetical protein
MNDRDRSVSLGSVLGFGFILLGIWNLFGIMNYKKPMPVSNSLIPAIMFIATGIIILVVRAIRKKRKA